MERYLALALLLALLAGAFALRTVHIDFGLPHRYHPDENKAVNETRRLLDRNAGLHQYRHPPLQRMLAYAGLQIHRSFTGISHVSRSDVYRALRRVSLIAGVIAVAAVYAMEKGATRFNLLKYTTSGEVTGDTNSVVAYVAAEFI